MCTYLKKKGYEGAFGARILCLFKTDNLINLDYEYTTGFFF